ncbi:MAG TPA: thiamine-phosphate kinase [Vicinamibacterales bacterium]
MKHGPSNTRDSLGERELIAAIRARTPTAAWLTIGIGDDAAVAEPARGALEILTTDALVESVHFDRRLSSPADIGWKALAVNLSDVAAMGGTPRLALLSLGVPEHMDGREVNELVDGFLELASQNGVVLAGGNVTRSPGPLFVDVTVTGFARRRNVLTRSGGRSGDDVYVSGTIGAAAAGLSWWKESGDAKELAGFQECIERHRRPQPRTRLGALLGRNRAASACMDLSDGLADAVRQVAEASGTGARIDASLLPIDPAVREWFSRRGLDAAAAAAAGGDDYELLFTVPRRRRGRLATVVRQARGVSVTRIGALTAEPGVFLVRGEASEPLPAGFVHF